MHEYGRDQGNSVTGGVVYRGSQLPAIVGRYVYGDYGSGRVWAISWNGSSVTGNVELDTLSAGPVAFGEDNDAEILIDAMPKKLADLKPAGTVPPLLVM